MKLFKYIFAFLAACVVALTAIRMTEIIQREETQRTQMTLEARHALMTSMLEGQAHAWQWHEPSFAEQ
jgi:hypothetical protein